MRIHKCIDIANKIAKHILKTDSVQNNEELKQWLNKNPQNENLWKELNQIENFEKYQNKIKQYPIEERWKYIEKKLSKGQKKSIFISKWMQYAAIIITIFGISGSIYYHISRNDNNIQDFPAGTNTARLILSNNQIITLSTDSKCIYNELKGVRIIQEQNGITYIPHKNVSDTLIENQIQTLRGMEYHITLSEETEIFMNAESHLKYPILFKGNSRIVSFHGEAYFNVAKNEECPFIIKIDDQELMVLGTSFNLRAYKDEPTIQVTLETGIVKMNNHLLHPGEQLTYNKIDKSITIKQVNTEEYIAWHNGKFLFRNERLEDIVKTLARWYNFEYEFINENIKNIRIGAYFERYKSMQPILNMLKKTELVDISVEDKVIKFNAIKK